MAVCKRCRKEIPYCFSPKFFLCENCYINMVNSGEIRPCKNCGKDYIVRPSSEDESMRSLCPSCYLERKQAIKSDNGKPRLDLVPLEVLKPLAQVREFALGKYGESGISNWSQIEEKRYLAALLRHLVAYQKDNNAVDEESGLPAIYHVLCNAAFLAIKHKNREKETKD